MSKSKPKIQSPIIKEPIKKEPVKKQFPKNAVSDRTYTFTLKARQSDNFYNAVRKLKKDGYNISQMVKNYIIKTSEEGNI